MFTGLIQDLGRLEALHPRDGGLALTIETNLDTGDFEVGESIAVNGACLTVEVVHGRRFTVLAGSETVSRTTVGRWRGGQRLHLERALRLGERLGGHLVQGHVDARARVDRLRAESASVVLWVRIPRELSHYVVEKGSLAVDGVSLTVHEIRDTTLRFDIIPHTWGTTRFGELLPGEEVNVEVDVLARYVERLLGLASPAGGLDRARLAENGFL